MADYNYKAPSWWELPEKCCYYCKYWGTGSKRRVASSHCLHNVLVVTTPDGGHDERTAVTFKTDCCPEFTDVKPVDRRPMTVKSKAREEDGDENL